MFQVSYLLYGLRAGSVRRVMGPGGNAFHLEPGTVHPCSNLLVPDVLDACGKSRKLHFFTL